MGNLFSGLNLYDVLRIMIPGLYFVIYINKLLSLLGIEVNSGSSELETAFFTFVFSFLAGILVYSFDFQNRFSFLKKNLPTSKIIDEFPFQDHKKIYSSYYFYYDNLNPDVKYSSEKHTNFFVMCSNLSMVSIVLSLITIPFIYLFPSLEVLFYFATALSILTMSWFAAYFIYTKFVIKYYDDAVTNFRKSKEYAELKHLSHNTITRTHQKVSQTPN